MSCTLATISNHTSAFDFGELFAVAVYLDLTCPAVCLIITGNSDSIWSGWSAYPVSDIWTRIVVWKLPLLQLVAQFPRPPLGFAIETASIVHLLGDPIDSMTSLMVTLWSCNSRAKLAKQLCSDLEIDNSHPEYQRTWKALAIIMVSYDECGKSEKVVEFYNEYLELRRDADTVATQNPPDITSSEQRLPGFQDAPLGSAGTCFLCQRELPGAHTDHVSELVRTRCTADEVRNVYEETANALAADRSTKSLPVVFAEIIFIGGWLIALIKAASSDPSPTNWANVEAHSVAFSGLYLWVTSAVVIGSVIGASQTEGSIPRLLQGLEYHVSDIRGCRVRRPSAVDREETEWCKTSTDRAIHGGVHSWRPTKWKHAPRDKFSIRISIGTLICFGIFSMLVVGVGLLTAAILSYYVPPRGPSCRHIPECLMFIIWLVSFAIEYVLERWLQKRLCCAVFCKDMFFALSNIAIVLITQIGIMNRCSCWTMWGSTWLHLPQLPGVKSELMYFIAHIAPWIVFSAILFQLVLCGAVLWKYRDAVRVFIQRDDGGSNLTWQKRTYAQIAPPQGQNR